MPNACKLDSSPHRSPIVLAILLLLFLPSFSFAQSEEISKLRSKKVRSYVTAAVSYLKKNSAARRAHLPEGFRYSEMGKQVSTVYYNRANEPKSTYLNTKLNTFVDLGRMLSWSDDRTNMVRVYTKVYSVLPAKYRKKLKSPSVLRKSSRNEVLKQYIALAKYLDRNFTRIIVDINPDVLDALVVNPIGSCSLEEGDRYSGAGGEASDKCDISDYDPNGLFRQMRFPLRDKITCIRDQGRRGTCTAHAVVAALETLHLAGGGNAQNLSEQDIYYNSEVYGDSQLNVTQMQLYGNAIDTALDTFVRRRFGIYFENEWGYNRSLEMLSPLANPATGLIEHPRSCASDYYGGTCEDTVWQTGANMRSFGIPTADQTPTAGDTVQHRITSNSTLPGIGAGTLGADFSLQQAILLLAAGIPVIASMDITDNFSGAGAAYVRDTSPDPVRGGHTMLMVGFIQNRNLPTGVTPATEEGYFIVKNSWGTDAGDCGFYYLDYRYVKRRLYYLNMILE